MKELWGSSHISAGHAAYLESLYETYITDPNSLSEEWINFFENLPHHATSNGEIYDVYQMTAAHKTLPLPSYVRVTRKDNQESIIVRVNDRGPFHPGRIIDLSYAAAVKLGIHKSGTSAVELEVIAVPVKGPEKWLQVSALSNEQSAKVLQQKLQAVQRWPVMISSNTKRNVHKVRIGPVPAGQATDKLITILRDNQLPKPLILAAHQL